MKKLWLMLGILVFACVAVMAESPSKVAILTSGDSWLYGEDVAGVREAIKAFGDKVIHLQLPKVKSWEPEPLIQAVLAQANNPEVKAIIVLAAPYGTVQAFARIRQVRKDIFLVAVDSVESLEEIEASADLVLGIDYVARVYNIVLAAKKMGASTFAHVSFSRYMRYKLIAYMRTLMILACKQLGMQFVDIAVSDPLSEIGLAGAQHYVLEHVQSWVEMYGQNTAFYTSYDALADALVVGLREHGGMFVEAGDPKAFYGYSDLFASAAASGDRVEYTEVVKMIGQELSESGADGRFGIWAYSYVKTVIMGLCEYFLDPKAGWPLTLNADRLFTIFKKLTPGCSWSYSRFVNSLTGQLGGEHNLLLQMDSYVFGIGFMGNSVPVPQELLLQARESYDTEEAQAAYATPAEPKSQNSNNADR